MPPKYIYEVIIYTRYGEISSLSIGVKGMAKNHTTLKDHTWKLGHIHSDTIRRGHLPKRVRDALRLLHMRGDTIEGIGDVETAQIGTTYRVTPIHLSHTELLTMIRHELWKFTNSDQTIPAVAQLLRDLETIRGSA